MPLKFTEVWFSGKGEYMFALPEKATILDAMLNTNHLKLAWMISPKDNAPGFHVKDRKFKAMPEWCPESTELDDVEAAYVGIVHWPVYPVTDNYVKITAAGETSSIPFYKEGTVAGVTFENYLIFEILE